MASKSTYLQVGTAALSVVAFSTAATVAFIAGSLQVQDRINFTPPPGIITGSTLALNGLDELKIFDFPCTNTGGLAKYPTCLTQSPFTTTGALKLAALNCGNTNGTFSMSGGFVKSPIAPINAANSFINLRGISVGTGAHLQSFDTGATLRTWNPADLLKFQTVTTTPPMRAGAFDCQVHVEMYDKYGT